MSRVIDRDRLCQADDVLQSLNAQGVDVVSTGRALYVRPAPRVTPGMVATLTGLRREICAVLKAREEAEGLIRRVRLSASGQAEGATAEARSAPRFPRTPARRSPCDPPAVADPPIDPRIHDRPH